MVGDCTTESKTSSQVRKVPMACRCLNAPPMVPLRALELCPPLRELRSMVVPWSEPGASEGRPPRASQLTWAELLLRVFGEDVLRCPGCGGRRQMISAITEAATIRRILLHLGLRTEPYSFEPARSPPQAELQW